MIQSFDEEENTQIQRFDTPTIRDFDFPKESGDQPMPFEQDEPAANPESEATQKTAEQTDQQQAQAVRPVVNIELEPLPEPVIQPENQESQTVEPVTNPEPKPLPIFVIQVKPQKPQITEAANPEPEPLPVSVTEPDEQEARTAEPMADTETSLPPEPADQSDEQMIEAPPPVMKLDPHLIPKFVNQLVKPPVYCPVSVNSEDESRLYVVDISEFKQQLLPPGFPETTVWGYGGTVLDDETCQVRYYKNAPGATFEAIRNMPIRVKWINNLSGPHLFPVDPGLPWANPNDAAQSPVPVVTQLDGGEVPSVFGGQPDAWFTYDGQKGPAYRTSLYTYPNHQEPATLWYHDHALGITRLNVYAGLAGFYLLRGGYELGYHKDYNLPKGRYEIPVVIQDRSFNTDGSLSFTNVGVNPDIHPYWDPEFFGDSIMVNGKVWPNLDVERRQYRFRLLNGSNARFYNLSMSNGMKFTQIGSDGGFLAQPAALDTLLLAPAERADILVDFSSVAPGTKIILQNDASAPFPDGDAPDPSTTGRIMQFTVPVGAPEPVIPDKLPEKLRRL